MWVLGCNGETEAEGKEKGKGGERVGGEKEREMEKSDEEEKREELFLCVKHNTFSYLFGPVPHHSHLEHPGPLQKSFASRRWVYRGVHFPLISPS